MKKLSTRSIVANLAVIALGVLLFLGTQQLTEVRSVTQDSGPNKDRVRAFIEADEDAVKLVGSCVATLSYVYEERGWPLKYSERAYIDPCGPYASEVIETASLAANIAVFTFVTGAILEGAQSKLHREDAKV